MRRLLRRAFAYQHDYDVFYVLNPKLHATSPHRKKLARMFDLYGSDSFRRYSAIYAKDIDLSQIDGHDEVLLGQPLGPLGSPEEVREHERRILMKMVGDRRVLVLPHPIERANDDLEKYRALPNATVFSAGVPSELLLLRLRPSATHTYASNAAVNYAMMHPGSKNYFYPVYRSRLNTLLALRKSLPNLIVSDEFATHDYPGDFF